jgi:hypothetical protein
MLNVLCSTSTVDIILEFTGTFLPPLGPILQRCKECRRTNKKLILYFCKNAVGVGDGDARVEKSSVASFLKFSTGIYSIILVYNSTHSMSSSMFDGVVQVSSPTTVDSTMHYVHECD